MNKEKKANVWRELNLNKSIFINKQLNIDSTDIRKSGNLFELEAISEYLHKHIKNISNIYSKDLELDKRYLFTQKSLRQQVDFEIFKIKTNKKKDMK